LGIRNIQKRLQLLYGENFCLRFSNNAQGGLVMLELPTG
jgi:sensor histidine kinase YesM